MRPDFKENYINSEYFNYLLENVAWENAGAPRMEAFMSLVPLTYGYDTRMGKRYYNSIEFDPIVKIIMDELNSENEYNVCFLNYYKDEKEHLGWHADDSPEMDGNHPIAVISFGEPRYIYVKDNEYKGEVPDENKILLTNGSLFIMPAGYQDNHLHKIPKGDKKMSGRISLTFRKYKI